LTEEGGIYEKATEDWAPFIVVDGNLYTGQNVSALFSPPFLFLLSPPPPIPSPRGSRSTCSIDYSTR